MKTLKISLLAFGVVISMNESAVAARDIEPDRLGVDTALTYGDLSDELWSPSYLAQVPQPEPFNVLSPDYAIPNVPNPFMARGIGVAGYIGGGGTYNLTRGNYNIGVFGTNLMPTDYNFSYKYNPRARRPSVAYESRFGVPDFPADSAAVSISFRTAGNQRFPTGFYDISRFNVLPNDVARNDFRYERTNTVQIQASKWRVPYPWSDNMPEGYGENNFHVSHPQEFVDEAYYWQGNEMSWKVHLIHHGWYRHMPRPHLRDYSNSPFLYRNTTIVVAEPVTEVKATLISPSTTRKQLETLGAPGSYRKIKTDYEPTGAISKPLHK